MSSQKDQKLSMFFSRNLSERDTDFLSLYFEQDHWGQLFALAEEHGSFQLLKTGAESFILRIGKYEFNVIRDFHRCIITIGQISTLTKGGAELLAKVADLLFYDRKNRFMIDTNSPEFEEMLWDICFESNIDVKPASKAQAARFASWAERRGIQYKQAGMGFASFLAQDDEGPEDSPTAKN